MTPQQRARALVVVGSVPVGLVLGLLALLAGLVAGVVVFVVVTAVLASWLWWGGERLVLARLGGRPADPVDDARLLNVVDGLCSTAGLRHPRVVVTEDRGANLAVAGRREDAAVLAVTTGLLDALSLIELEAVVADGLVQIRRGDIIPATVAVATFGAGATFALGGRDRAAEVDRAGVALTRYPPALVGAFETMARVGTAVGGVPRSMAHLWLVPPGPGPSRRTPGEGTGHGSAGAAMAERVAALRSL